MKTQITFFYQQNLHFIVTTVVYIVYNVHLLIFYAYLKHKVPKRFKLYHWILDLYTYIYF